MGAINRSGTGCRASTSTSGEGSMGEGGGGGDAINVDGMRVVPGNRRTIRVARNVALVTRNQYG